MAKAFTPIEPIETISLETLVGEAVGAASVSWHADGVFDEKFATSIVDVLLAYVENNYERNA